MAFPRHWPRSNWLCFIFLLDFYILWILRSRWGVKFPRRFYYSIFRLIRSSGLSLPILCVRWRWFRSSFRPFQWSGLLVWLRFRFNIPIGFDFTIIWWGSGLNVPRRGMGLKTLNAPALLVFPVFCFLPTAPIMLEMIVRYTLVVPGPSFPAVFVIIISPADWDPLIKSWDPIIIDPSCVVVPRAIPPPVP